MSEKTTPASFNRSGTILKLFLYGIGFTLLGVILCALFLQSALGLAADQLAELTVCLIWIVPLFLLLMCLALVLLFIKLYRQGPAMEAGDLDQETAAWIWKQLVLLSSRATLLSMALWIAGVVLVSIWMVKMSALSLREAVPAGVGCIMLGTASSVGFYFFSRNVLKPVLFYMGNFLPPDFEPPHITGLGKKQFLAFVFIAVSISSGLVVQAYFSMQRAELSAALSMARQQIGQGVEKPASFGEYHFRPFTVDFEGGFQKQGSLRSALKDFIRSHPRLLRHSRWMAGDTLRSELTRFFSRWIELPDYVPLSRASIDNRDRGWIMLQREPDAGGLHPGMIIERQSPGLMAGRDASLFIMALFFVTLVIITVLYSTGLSRDVARPVNDLTRSIREAEEKGEVSPAPLTTDDEIGVLTASFNRMGLILEGQMQSARRTLHSVQAAVHDLNRLMQNLASMSSEQAADATEHATSVQEVSSTSEEIAATLRTIAENAGDVEEVAGKSLAACRSGQEQLQEVIAELDQVGSRSAEQGERMLSLQEQANRIEGILEFIEEISEKTNLIALNAAIEASAAGEGKERFPLIAKEMRKLAEKTMSGAREIKSVLDDLQEATGKAIISTEEGEKKLAAARKAADQADYHFQSIIHWAGETSRAVQEISSSSNQQTSATDHLASALAEIKDVASRFADGTSHLDSFMKELNQVAGNLENLIEKQDSREKDHDQ
ncbi:MAG: methyl-accepting chemotaxis protein [bacterium]